MKGSYIAVIIVVLILLIAVSYGYQTGNITLSPFVAQLLGPFMLLTAPLVKASGKTPISPPGPTPPGPPGPTPPGPPGPTPPGPPGPTPPGPVPENMDDILKSGSWNGYTVGDDLKLVGRTEYFKHLSGNVYAYYDKPDLAKLAVLDISSTPMNIRFYEFEKIYATWKRSGEVASGGDIAASIKGKWPAGVIDDDLKLPTGEQFHRIIPSDLKTNPAYWLVGNAFWYSQPQGLLIAVVDDTDGTQTITFRNKVDLKAVWKRQ